MRKVVGWRGSVGQARLAGCPFRTTYHALRRRRISRCGGGLPIGRLAVTWQRDFLAGEKVRYQAGARHVGHRAVATCSTSDGCADRSSIDFCYREAVQAA